MHNDPLAYFLAGMFFVTSIVGFVLASALHRRSYRAESERGVLGMQLSNAQAHIAALNHRIIDLEAELNDGLPPMPGEDWKNNQGLN